jgi:hypothetical protein
MNTRTTIMTLLGWVGTLLLQVVAAQLCVFLLVLVFWAVNTAVPAGWLLLIFAIWLGFTAGIYGAGWLALRLKWVGGSAQPGLKLACTALAGLVPLIVLALVGLPLQTGSPAFEELILNTWQPRLAFFALTFGILGFHLASWYGPLRNPKK